MDNASDRAARLSPIPPPRNKRRRIEVVRAPKGGAERRGICLNQEVHACLMHWDDVLSAKLRCSGTPSCRFCPYLPAARWYAYMPVFQQATGKVACFEITLEAARLCSQLSTKKIPVRGKEITIFRVGEGKFGQGRCIIRDFRDLPIPPAEETDDLMDMLCGGDEACFDPSLHKKKPKGGGE